MKKVYLFCPSFFGYDKSIKEELERLGAEVTLFDERPFKSFMGKTILRLNLKWLISFYINRYFKKIIFPVINELDILVFINPESINSSILSKIRTMNSDLKIICYMWDSFENKQKSSSLISYSDSFFTFDPSDAEKYNINFLPLFYIDSYKRDYLSNYYKYDFLFFGTAHSERYEITKKITSGYSSYLFYYTPSKLVFLYKKYICRELKGMSIGEVSLKPLSKDSILSLLDESKVVIDINHPSQVGLTMRTIEMLGAKKKIITTNKEVLKYDFYNLNNIFLYTEETKSKEVIDFLRRPYCHLDDSLYEKYSIKSWVINLFEEL